MAPDDVATEVQRRAPAETSSCILDDPGTLTISSLHREGCALKRDSIIGGYQIVREVGVGGMGIVYEAMDLRLRRRAAIKMIRGGVGVSADAVRRFQTEAEAVAQAQHPNIVQIYDVGWHDGQPYVALEFLSGGSLYAKVENKPQPPCEAATLVRHLADAMQQAHISGVIHRDLKPANILFTTDGTPKITDFGAARLTADEQFDGGEALTKTGVIIGTPQYMAPEQARGETITSAVDVYALGAVLYHLLTGRPPHDGPNSYDVLHAAVSGEPIPPRRLVPGVPRDLETICQKALAKHPSQRYSTAEAMAADLGRFLAGESILARPDGTLVRIWKKARRKPAIAGLAVGIVLVTLAGIAGVAWQYTKAIQNSSRAVFAQKAAEKAAASKARSLYSSQVSVTALMLESGDWRKAQLLLATSGKIEPGQQDYRHWEWHYLNRLGSNYLWSTMLFDDAKTIDYVWTHRFAQSPDRKTLMISGGNPYLDQGFDAFVPAQAFFTNTDDGKIFQVWKDYLPEAAREIIWRDEQTVVVSSHLGGIRILRYPSGEVLHDWPSIERSEDNGIARSVLISPDGRSACRASARNELQILDTDTGMVTRTLNFKGYVNSIPEMVQSSKDWRIVVSVEDVMHVIDPRTGSTLLTAPDTHVHNCAIDATNRYLAVTHSQWQKNDSNGRLDVYDLQTGQRLSSRTQGPVLEHTRLEFSPDSRSLAVLHNQSTWIRVDSVPEGRTEYELRGHTNRIFNFSFSPDGRHIATASNDGSVRLWNLAEAREVVRMRGHTTGARTLAFDPNGWRLYTGGMDGLAIAWDLTRERTDGTLMPVDKLLHKPSHGGAFLGGLWFGSDGYARSLDTSRFQMIVFDPATYTMQNSVIFEDMLVRPTKIATDFALSADGRRLFGIGKKHACLWDATTGKIIRQFPEIRGLMVSAAISADGSIVAGYSVDGRNEKDIHRELFIATADGKYIHRETPDGYGFTALAFDPRCEKLYMGITAVRSEENGIHVLTLADLSREKIAREADSSIRSLAVSPNGEWLAGIDFHNDDAGPRVFAVNLADRSKNWARVSLGPSTGLAFSPDSRRLAVARFDDTLTIYVTAEGDEALFKRVPSKRLGDYAFPARVAFSPNGRSLVMSHSAADLSVWQTDDWTATDEERLAARRREAERAAYAFHFRGAGECLAKPDQSGYRHHADWLDKLPPPNEFLKREWDRLKARRKP